MKKILAVVGSYRKGKTIDTLVDKAIEGAKSMGDTQIDKINLIDQSIQYCKNCMVCLQDDPDKPLADCVISDDMDTLHQLVDQADAYIFGTPVNMGAVTAVMKTFLERICWIHAKPGRYPIKGCPTPRSGRKKQAIIIVSSGAVPTYLRMFCDDATSCIKSTVKCSLNASVIGSMYAGGIHTRELDGFSGKAYELGRKLMRY